MRIESTRTASLVLAFGFFFLISCSSQKHTLDDARVSFEEERYEDALTGLNSSLRDDPGNSDLLLLKAETLHQLARSKENPAERLPYYSELNRTAAGITEYHSDRARDQMRSLIQSAWEMEYLAGADLFLQLGDEIGRQEERILPHFENAMEISPGKADSYAMAASYHYHIGQLARAIETLELARENVSDLPPEMEEKHAFLLLEEGDLESAIGIYSDLADRFPDHEEILHGLANAYILDGRHRESVELLRSLSEEQPANPVYRQALATELYFLFEEMALYTGTDDEPLRSDTFPDQIVTLIDEAETHYQTVLENRDSSDEITYVVAAFYKNSARHLFQLSERSDQDLSERLDERALELLLHSVPVWRQLAETNPESSEVWKSMSEIYTMLGMDEEAEEAGTNVNF